MALGSAQTADNPNFGGAGKDWQKDGWLVQVKFTEVDFEVRPKNFINELKPHLAQKYAPLPSNGDGNQVAYLVSISDDFAKVLLETIGKPAAFFTEKSSCRRKQ